MTIRRRFVDWALTAILIVVPALVLRSSLVRGERSGLDEAVYRITAPLQAATSWVAESIGGAWSRYVALIDVEDENHELREDNERLRNELSTMARRAHDIEALEELALVRKRTESDMVGARVIAAPLSPQFRVLRLRIDRGDREVRPGMAVISGTGPVGLIEQAFGDYADVVLLSDTRNGVDVAVKRTGRRGVLLGLGKSDAYGCKISKLELATDSEQRARVGDEVVTTAFDQRFPAGLVVGTITKLEGDDAMFQRVEVTPTVDPANLRAVMVVLARPPPEDPDAKTKKRSDAAFGARPL